MTIEFLVMGVPAPAVRKNFKKPWQWKRALENPGSSLAKEFSWRNKVVLAARPLKKALTSLSFPISVSMVFWFPKIPRRIDGDNLFKATLDALVYDGLLPGDSCDIVQAGMFYVFESDEPRAKIKISETKGAVMPKEEK